MFVCRYTTSGICYAYMNLLACFVDVTMEGDNAFFSELIALFNRCSMTNDKYFSCVVSMMGVPAVGPIVYIGFMRPI